MPEYLAPGVYVEETSFRSKTIEGVSTSTTAFAGPTRRGPLGETPELVTSFGDFERIYGGLQDLSFGTSYIAHGVRNYFAEGGSRLYVSRVYHATDGGVAESPLLVGTDAVPASNRARFVARTPGSAGNGRVVLRQVVSPVTTETMQLAEVGSMVRVGGDATASAAKIVGGVAPFNVPDEGVLRLVVSGANVEITFRGETAEAVADDALPDTVDLDDGNTSLDLVIDGVPQAITLPTDAASRGDFVTSLNAQIRGGYARLTVAGEGTPNRLVIGSDRQGRSASVVVSANTELQFPSGANVSGAANPTNNVADLRQISADEVNALLMAAGNSARAALDGEGRLAITTVATGAAATLAVGDAGDNSTHEAFGFTLPAAGADPATGTDGSTTRYFVKVGSVYHDATGNPPTNLTGATIELVTVAASVEDGDGIQTAYEELGLDRRSSNWIGDVLAVHPTRRADALENPFGLQVGDNVTGFALRDALFAAGNERTVHLSGGNDGAEPNQTAYESALDQLQQREDISIVAAPGYSAYSDANGIQSALITHVRRRRAYRVAVLDSQPDATPGQVRDQRGRIDSTYAALYYPWIVISNPLARPGASNTPREIVIPPSASIAGIYARNDVERGVHKAPANEVIRNALRLERDVNFAEQQTLNPLGINCLRYFPGRGFRVWGARTASSDSEWKYVNVRRYLVYLEASIDRSTQSLVFEPNGPRLWENVREMVSDFLYNEWVSGALLGASPQEAFFVRCDRSTMTQNDLDNGRMICLIGVAPLRPAEFVIFRIGQKTADARN